jgi:hypothetical protein
LVESNPASTEQQYEANLFTAAVTAASQPGVVAVSISYGFPESSGQTQFDSEFTTPAGHAGVTFLASSGDSGAPALYPSSSPNVLAVGGTSLLLNADNTIMSESGWDGSCCGVGGSGGGPSAVEAQPAYQKGVVTQSTTQRTTPDVAYDSDPNTGFQIYDSYGQSGLLSFYGGTSIASPQWAAIIAIADQGRALAGKAALDGPSQTLPTIYSMPASNFHDITTGGSTGSPSYSCGPGYDLVTGRGSPVANLIVASLVGESTTTTTLVSTASPSVFGQSVTFFAVVRSQTAGTPTGTVTFENGTNTLGTAVLHSSTAILSTSALTVGTHSITTIYSGDANFAGNQPAPLLQTVTQDSSAATLLSTASPSVFGQKVTFFVLEKAGAPGSGTPTGTITFRDAATSLGTAVLNSSGVATFTTSALAVTSHTIAAVYSGDANFLTNTSAILTQTVSPDVSTAFVLSAFDPSVFGQGVVFTALVLANSPGAGTPSGTATFKDGATTLGTVALSSAGRATLTRYALTAGNHLITVSYSGDANFLASASGTLTQTVNPDSTVATIASSVNPSKVGQAVTFTTVVNPLPQGSGAPTGPVTFEDNGVSIGTGTLHANANGFGSTATFTTSTLAAGANSITAIYAGDANFKASTSVVLTQTVNATASAAPLITALGDPPALGAGLSPVPLERPAPTVALPNFASMVNLTTGTWIGAGVVRGTAESEYFAALGAAKGPEPALSSEVLVALDQFFASTLRDRHPSLALEFSRE